MFIFVLASMLTRASTAISFPEPARRVQGFGDHAAIGRQAGKFATQLGQFRIVLNAAREVCGRSGDNTGGQQRNEFEIHILTRF
jgi:hypothetical protein